MVRWGILGCGKIAQKFVNDLLLIDGCCLTAVGSRSKEKAEAFKIKNNATYSFGSYEDLVSCEEVDVIYVATPHPMHKDNAILCLNNGKHVLCEKPFAMNSTQVEEMIQAAKSNQKFLMEAIWTQFFPYLQKLKELIADDQLGEIRMIEADFGFKAGFDPSSRLFDKQLGGGALLDIGIYPLFLCHSLLGPPAEISSSAIIGKTGIDESTCINLKWNNGAMASLNCTILCDTASVAKVYGTKSYAHIDARWHEAKSMTIRNRDGILDSFAFDDNYTGYAYEIMEVNRCIKNGQLESEVLPLSFSKELMESIDLIKTQIDLSYNADAL